MKNLQKANTKKPRAILYARTATESQEHCSQSIERQKEILTKYCGLRGIEIHKSYEEQSVSGRTFDRPVFNQLEEFVKINYKNIDFLLVSRWDRLGRNLEEMLACIKRFKRLGIEINAVEQFLDFNSPDPMMAVAFYLMPTIENDKISQRTADAMRAAAKGGRYVYKSPMGYEFTHSKDGRKILSPSKDVAMVMFIQEAFKKYSSGKYSLVTLRKEICKKYALSCSSQRLEIILKNGLYAGFVSIKETPYEKGYSVKGLHKPLVPEKTFDAVQKHLTRSKK